MSTDRADKATILIVDDNPTNLKVLSETLADSGWQILVATDGEIAIEQAEYARPNLILLDVMMPGIDGFETCKRLKKNAIASSIPVIFMTALNDKESKVKGLSLGAVDYITKPFAIEEVLARVKIHLDLYFLTQKLEKQNFQLESRVVERTAELSKTLKELKQSQLQLIQNEKMSALGQLVAGVAHEINNPLGFVLGNLDCAKDYIKDLIDYVNLYQQKHPKKDNEISEFEEDIDLEYLLEDLPKIVSSMKIGAERIGNISKSLRIFSRTDNSAKELFDIHEGLDTTLLILKHRIKANEKRPTIEIVKKYGKLSPIECYPGPLNQAFMNLIANAIDALEESNQGRSYQDIEVAPNQIRIATYQTEDDRVCITIADNGPGIPQEVQKRIFETLFTTKHVGQGTGLGLSIARQIVEEKHEGQLLCFSQLGEGAEFLIKIPIAGNKS